MSAPAVLQFVAVTVNGTRSARFPKPALARISPRVPEVMRQPMIHIWTPRYNEERATMQRGAGFKKVKYLVALYVKAQVPVNWQYIDTGFFDLVEAITNKLRIVTMPVQITDTDNGTTSNIVAIGEQFETDIGAVRGIGRDRRYLLFESLIKATVEEWQTG